MTFPRYAPLLEGAGKDRVHALLAGDVADPAGLALGLESPDGQTFEALSLFVKPRSRGRGVGRALLHALEEAAQARGARKIAGSWAREAAGAAALEAVLRACGWTRPRPSMVLVRCTRLPGLMAAAERFRVPASFDLVEWSAVSPADRSALDRQLRRTPWSASPMSPFSDPEPVEPACSLALYRDGQISGLAIAHRLTARSVRFSYLAVHPEFQGTGLGAQLLIEALRRFETIRDEVDEVRFAVRADNAEMMRFAARCLLPGAADVRTTATAWKALGAEPAVELKVALDPGSALE
jgi:GNAT superfamily N-acetyltransferase